MNRYAYLILSIFILSFVAKAGDVARIPPEYNIFLLFQGYTINAYNATGFSNALYSTISDLPDANPASLTDYDKPGIGLSMEYQSGINNAFGTGYADHERINQYIPQSLAFIYPFKSFQLGVGFYQKYSGWMDVGKIAITDPVNPDSVIAYLKPDYKRYIYSWNLIASRNFKNFLGQDHQLSLGIQLNLDYFKGNEKLSTLEVTYSDEAFSWKFGLGYSFQYLLSLGVIFDKGSSFSGNIKQNQSIFLADSIGNFPQIRQVQLEPIFKSKTPDKLILGYQLKGIPWLWINGSFNLVYWHMVYSNLENHLDYSVNFIINGNEKYSYSIGYYNTDVKTDESYYISASNYNAHYISAGLRARLESMAIYVTIMDSHLSTKTRRQTIGKLGFEYQF